MAIPDLILRKDKNANVTYGLNFPPETNSTIAGALTALTEETFVIPENATDAVFTYAIGTNNFVTISSNPITVPGAGLNFYDGELNPIARKVIPGGTLRIISDSNSFVVVRFFQVPQGEK